MDRLPRGRRATARGVRARRAGGPRRRARARLLPGAAQGRLAALRHPAPRPCPADPLPARPVQAARQATPGGDPEARPVRRSRRRRVDGPRPVLDPQRQPPARGAHQAQGGDHPRHPHPGPRRRLPDPRPQHREGAQRQGEGPRGHPDVPRAPGDRARGDGGGLRLPVRGAALHHARAPLRRAAALRRRRVRTDSPPGRQVPQAAAPQGVRRARAARRVGPRRG